MPSERELAEQLNIGRSSVREALRAMEILGLIETKRGEGTFIADFRNHNLVELLSSFILQRKEAKADLRDTKKNIELAIILQMIDQKKELDMSKWDRELDISGHDFEWLFAMNNNKLLTKIWVILAKFENTIDQTKKHFDKQSFIKLLHAINSHDMKEAMAIYNKYFDNTVN